MFSKEELKSLDTKYFAVIVADEYDVTVMSLYISDKLTILHGQSDHLSRRFRSLISERYSRGSKSFL